VGVSGGGAGAAGRSIAFGSPDNAAVILGADGSETPVARGPKTVLSDVIWDLALARLT
jgi:phosphopantothenoylcysteine decarboxylase/phosphopantothenate--cysteine ligase